MDQDAIDNTRILFEQWEIYEAVIRHNYMLHRELVESFARCCQRVPAQGRIVDLGCGDGWLAWNVLRAIPFEQYLGVDVSEAAIERAATRFREWNGRFTLRNGDLAAQLMEIPDSSVDLVLASYSIHHFQEEAKRAVIAHVARVLKPGGLFLWADVMRRDEENYRQAVDRVTHRIRTECEAMTERQREMAVEHVESSDFPESVEWMTQAAAQVGMSLEQSLVQDPNYAAFAFAKT
ncbi:putative methyltransferase [Planctomycetes bacterium Pan216]|uniref:Putative methyltransferase n=1 Tax=Kolteria novifilia TaxID=2527975 RepID=A0A518B2N2_9BACT|nr:putative methyltransferase [Planctomycetes bacterium Pan216]